MSKLNRLFGASTAVSMVLFLGGCLEQAGVTQKNTSSTSLGQSQSPGGGGSSGGTDDGVFDTVPANGAFTITSSTPSLSVNLGTTGSANYSVVAAGNYSGHLTIHIEDEEIQAIDPGKNVNFTISPASFDIGPGQTVPFKVTNTIGTLAPDFVQHYHVVVEESSGRLRKTEEMETPFTVNPIYEIKINPTNNPALNKVIWSTDVIDPNTGVGKKAPVSLAQHVGGVTVRFLDYDTAPHIIHGSGAIPHQNTATMIMSLATNGVNPAGKTYVPDYSPKITNQNVISGNYYLHDAESGSKAGTINFNVKVMAAPAPTPTPVAGAKFATEVKPILTASCTSCHAVGVNYAGTGAPAGNITLDTYAGVLTIVSPKDGAGSLLYNSVLNDDMPLTGTKLSAAQKATIKSWIDAGALNN